MKKNPSGGIGLIEKHPLYLPNIFIVEEIFPCLRLLVEALLIEKLFGKLAHHGSPDGCVFSPATFCIALVASCRNDMDRVLSLKLCLVPFVE